MKILIDARLYGLENAGLGRYVMNLINYLSYLDRKNEYVIFLRKKYINEISLPPNWKKVIFDFRHYSFQEQLFLPFLIYKEKPDLVHFPHFNVPILYFGKFVVTIHDLIMHRFVNEDVTTLPKLLYFLRRLGYKLSFNKAIFGSSKIIVPSGEVKKEVQVYYPKINSSKIISIYEGISTELVTNQFVGEVMEKYNLKKPYFIYYGNCYPHKNLIFLIEGIKKYNEEVGSLYLYLSSSRSVFLERLQKKIKEIGAKNYISFLGFVSDHEMKAILNHSKGFIYPSLLEGFGLQGLEAMISGTLVLASDIPVFKEIYKGKIIYFDPKDLDSLIEAIKKVMKMEENERQRVINAGKAFIKRYSWEKMAKETMDTYNKSLQGGVS